MNPFYLPQASTLAPKVDAIFFGLLIMSAVIMLVVIGLVVGFAIVYRQGSPAKRGPLPDIVSREIEIGWTVATLFLFLFLFWWVASMQLSNVDPPKDAVEIHVVAKQWMWKIQHPDGTREIDTLHVPVGLPVKLIMTSQDAIHSFYVPAFRVKQDVLPGRYTQIWFTATEPGTYPLLCAEYCGLDHARMGGKVVVMSQADYARWTTATPPTDSLAAQGQRIFVASGCGGCHATGSAVRAPPLEGVYGARVPLEGGGFVVADEAYLHDSIVLPAKQVVAGYQPIMPSYDGVLGEDKLVALIAYLKSLKGPS